MLCPVHNTKMLELFTSVVCERCERGPDVSSTRVLKFMGVPLKLPTNSHTLVFEESTLRPTDFGYLDIKGHLAVWQSNNNYDFAALMRYFDRADLVVDVHPNMHKPYVVKSRFGPEGRFIDVFDDVLDFIRPHSTFAGSVMMVLSW